MTPPEAVGRAPKVATEIAQVVEAPRRKLAKDRLEELLEIAIGCTAYHQPSLAPEAKKNVNADWAEFKDWLKIAADIGHKLSHFQSPTFRAVVVTTPGDGEQVIPSEPYDEIGGGAERAQQTYLRLVKGG